MSFLHNIGGFRCFLEDYKKCFLRDFEETYHLGSYELRDYLWNDLQANLANIQEDVLFDDMYTDLGLESGNIGIEDTLIYHFRFNFKYIEKLTVYLKK